MSVCVCVREREREREREKREIKSGTGVLRETKRQTEINRYANRRHS